MFSFRQHSSTQDIALQLKEDLIEYLDKNNKYSTFALDVKRAFDNMSHESILQNLQRTDCGERALRYVHNLITDRTVTIGVGNFCT